MMRELVLRVLRVPPEPSPPAGESVRIFRAASNFLRYRIATWGLAQVGALSGLIFGLIFLRIAESQMGEGTMVTLLRAAEILGWIAVIAQIPFTFAIVRLDYELRWYIVTDRSLRIREGITKVTEKTMTFRNIQNLSIRQGPLQRLLGIADVEVRSAGGGGSRSGSDKEGAGAEDLHVAYFRGVGNAGEIRDLIRERVRRHRDSGLGDPDERRHAEETHRSTGTDAAREVLEEIRALKGLLTRG